MTLKYVLDASGINRSSHDYSQGGYCIPKSVYDEIREDTARTAVEEAVRAGLIKVLEPSAEYASKARSAAEETGDLKSLSQPDQEVLALGLEHMLTIVSDDYAIQNTAAKLGLDVSPVTQDGIKKRIKWIWTCRGCKRTMSGPGECNVCGHKAAKKPV